MENHLLGIRPVVVRDEDQFGALLHKVLSPSQPLASPDFLRGRAEQLKGIKKALYAPGRHIFIHGFRGVGKSSLAQTAANAVVGDGPDPIILGCDRSNTFEAIIKDIYDEVMSRSPGLEKVVREVGGGLNIPWIAASGRIAYEEGKIEAPTSINEAVRLIKFIVDKYSSNLVIVIDEFDQIKSPSEQESFANFIKQVSDKHIAARFIFCGIGETVDELMSAHASADRYFHTVKLERLPYEARWEIIDIAADSLGVVIDDTTKWRIAKISDGFPHYVHLISEKLFWRAYEANNGGMVTPELFSLAMNDASDAMDMKLKQPYELATKKYKNDYEQVLFACADGHELHRRSSDIFSSFERIVRLSGNAPVDRAKFNQRMNRLKTPSYGSILTANRQGWYEFSEKIVRGYVRLRAEQADVELEVDHPAARRRHGWRRDQENIA